MTEEQAKAFLEDLNQVCQKHQAHIDITNYGETLCVEGKTRTYSLGEEKKYSSGTTLLWEIE
jgi:hypothetical protein